MTAATVWAGINDISLDAFDSSGATFTPVRGDGGAGFTEDAGSLVVDFAHYDKGDGTLEAIGVGRYSTHWIYRHADDGHVYSIYGKGSYKLAEAQVENEPSKPDHLTDFGLLIGCIIAPYGGGSFTLIQMVTDTFFTGTAVADHAELSNLQGGAVGEYNHLTDAQLAFVIADTKHVELFMDCLADTQDQIVADEDLTAATPITCTLALQPDIPRNVSLTLNAVALSAFDIDVLGVNAEGETVTENFVFAGGLIQVGNIAFARITSVTVNSIAGDDAGDILDVGISSKVGLSNSIKATGDVYKIKLGSVDMPPADYTVNATYNTVDLSTGGAIAAYSDYTIWYKHSL